MVPLRGWAAHAVTPSDKGTNLFCFFWCFIPEEPSIFSLHQKMIQQYFKTERKWSRGSSHRHAYTCAHGHTHKHADVYTSPFKELDHLRRQYLFPNKDNRAK